MIVDPPRGSERAVEAALEGRTRRELDKKSAHHIEVAEDKAKSFEPGITHALIAIAIELRLARLGRTP